MGESAAQIKKYVRAANYCVAAQLYLQDNFLLTRPLSSDDIKPRLLGHWGTCPGINFIYANLNRLIKERAVSMMFVLGPGHGFPALQANLFMEGTLEKYYPEAKRNAHGLAYIAKQFSWPYGFPSHSNPGAPGVILEGGELGYSLSTSFGAALDNPDLIVACVVGDGEAETGPAATAWHANKLLNPAADGAVLPILHVNGYKISGPTVFGRMSDDELRSLFYGYGWEPMIVAGDGDDVYEKMIVTLDAAHTMITDIQTRARSGEGIERPRFPMIVLKTPKGWTGIKEFKGNKIEGNCLSHQVVCTEAKADAEQRAAVEAWMRSYRFEELFDERNGFIDDIRACVPEETMCMSENDHAYSGRVRRELHLPHAKEFVNEGECAPGGGEASSMRKAGAYLKTVLERNADNKNFRIMSPDETYSNKLDEIFAASPRQFAWPIMAWDKDLAHAGRVMEMLSEHTLQGLAQGYILSGRHAVFSSYEAFVPIVGSMADQYAKFLKVALETPWRGNISSFNYILTSSGWRQEHNGFSHQNPGFIDNMLAKHGCFINVYFPPDATSTIAVLERCLKSKNEINIIVAGKTPEPCWLTMEQAWEELVRGLMVWDFASDPDPDPDIVFVGIGDYMTKEALAAIDIVKTETPEVKARFVNIVELSALGIGSAAACRLGLYDFDKYFTADKPVIFNFHGYPEAIRAILVDKKNPGRFSVHGYIENGSTTTPFDMHVRNNTSRYHLAIEAFHYMAERGVIPLEKEEQLTAVYRQKLADHGQYIRKYGVDPVEIDQWKWTRQSNQHA